MIRRVVVGVSLAAALLVACAEREWIYEKKGATPTRIDRDKAACEQEAFDPRAFALFRSGRVDQEVFRRCMERKGYTATPAE